MARSVRSIVAVLVGAAAAIAVVSASDALVGALWPLAPGTDLHDPAQLQRAMGAMPAAAFVALVIGWAVAAAVGATVATRIAAPTETGAPRRRPGVIVTALLLAGTAANLVSIPHPWWVWAAALVAIPTAGWLATQVAAPGAARLSGAASA
jgi:hypothetical protein